MINESSVIDVTKQQIRVQEKIADRYIIMANKYNIEAPDKEELQISLFFCERCGHNPRVDWDRLLEADEFNFAHDVSGIHGNASRDTTVLEDGTLVSPGYLKRFRPRFTKPTKEAGLL